MRDTEVTFPAGAVSGTATVQAASPLPDQVVADLALPQPAPGGLVAVVVDSTPFHPVDHTWPDQPADAGTVAGVPVVGCVTGAVSPEGVLSVGPQISVRRGTEGWHWVVLHLLPAADAADKELAPGAQVDLMVDADVRHGFSRGHSACHLAALALNQVASGLWDKDPGRPDSLGHPDLDSLAITLSRIDSDGALDEYRLGKSIRKKGLRTADLLDGLPALQDAANALLDEWTASGGASAVETDGDQRLTARRRWTAHLQQATVTIPCGGTHVADLSELQPTSVRYEITDEGFRVLTRVG